jgi:hypothetical protein
MKKIFHSIIIALAIFPSTILADSELENLPSCSEILNPTAGVPENARGVALIYNIERKFNDKRTSLSVHALYIPEPSRFGDFDSYEVLASIPNEVSWIFPLTKYAENNWAGKLDEISALMRPTRIKVRPINSKTHKFGPVVLVKNVSCK